jgi:hypothetical protein
MVNRHRSRSHVTADGQSASQSVCQDIEPTLGLVTRYYFLSEGSFLKVAVLSLWGTLSDERSGSVNCHSQYVVIYQYLHQAFTLHVFYSSAIYVNRYHII